MLIQPLPRVMALGGGLIVAVIARFRPRCRLKLRSRTHLGTLRLPIAVSVVARFATHFAIFLPALLNIRTGGAALLIAAILSTKRQCNHGQQPRPDAPLANLRSQPHPLSPETTTTLFAAFFNGLTA